ncbi:hypothetical protein BDAP_000652 [Binucleata daphniae]
MNIKHLLLYFFTFASIFCFVTSCIRKKEIDTGTSYINKRKFLDPDFLEQSLKLNECYVALPVERILEYIDLKNSIAKDMYEKIEAKLVNIEDKDNMKKREFYECFMVLAMHTAKKIMCPDVADIFTDGDKILYYAYQEFKDCVKQKNKPYKNPLLLDASDIIKQ